MEQVKKEDDSRPKRLSITPATIEEKEERLQHIFEELNPEGLKLSVSSKGKTLIATRNFPAKYPICRYGGVFVDNEEELKRRINYLRFTEHGNKAQQCYIYKTQLKFLIYFLWAAYVLFLSTGL